MAALSKTCTKCNTEKEISHFNREKTSMYGYRSVCRLCDKATRLAKNEILKKKDLVSFKLKEQAKCAKYYKRNSEKVKARVKEYREQNKEIIDERCKGYRLNRRDLKIAWDREYYHANKEEINARRKVSYAEDPRPHIERACKYASNNRIKVNSYLRKRSKTVSDLEKLRKRLGSGTSAAFKAKGWKKESKTQSILGADYSIVKKYIERQFLKGMSWNNRNEWHIDHIIPLSSASTKDELLTLCHFTNLQPLWAYDNLSKGCKIFPTQMKIAI